MQKAPRNVKLKAMHLYSPLSLESLTSDVALKFMMIADINHKAANTHVPIIIVVVESVISPIIIIIYIFINNFVYYSLIVRKL